MRPGETHPAIFDLYEADAAFENIDKLAKLKHLTGPVRDKIAADHDELILSNTLSGCESAIERELPTYFIYGMQHPTNSFLSKPYDHFDYRGTQLATRIVWTQYLRGGDTDRGESDKCTGDVFLLALAEESDRFILPHHVKVGWGIDEEGRFGAFRIGERPADHPLYSDVRHRFTAEPLDDAALEALVDELERFTGQA